MCLRLSMPEALHLLGFWQELRWKWWQRQRRAMLQLSKLSDTDWHHMLLRKDHILWVWGCGVQCSVKAWERPGNAMLWSQDCTVVVRYRPCLCARLKSCSHMWVSSFKLICAWPMLREKCKAKFLLDLAAIWCSLVQIEETCTRGTRAYCQNVSIVRLSQAWTVFSCWRGHGLLSDP